VKTLEGLHNTDDRYIWFDENERDNGGFEGFELVTDFSLGADNDICFGFSEGDASTYCHSQAFVERVNQAALCGASDWRMPTREESLSLIHFQLENIDDLRPAFAPSIDLDFFPNTEISVVTDMFETARYMTSSPYAPDALGLSIWGVFFGSGVSVNLLKTEQNPIRLVRAPATP